MSEITLAALGESRVAGTADLMQLYVDAKKTGFSRNLPDGIAASLDPDGNHVFTLVQVDLKTDPSRELPTHHRLSVLVKLRDTGRPYCDFLDVAADAWLKLYTRDEAKAYPHDEQGRLRLPLRLVEMEEVT
jgi:hypothetical protein